MSSARHLLEHPPDFTLVLGGPLYQILRRSHLAGGALELLGRRIIAVPLVGWVPLLVLSTLERDAVAARAAVPFLLDAEVHVRFLIMLPLLIVAELVVHQRMRFVVRQFLERDLVPESSLDRFDAIVASALRMRNSVLAEILLVAFVYAVGMLVVWPRYIALGAPTWYATPGGGGGLSLTWAGTWYAAVGVPLSQFLLARWYYRIFIWARFLWQTSRIELDLIPAHPDRVGGLGFLSGTVHAFLPLAVAHGTILAGWIANRIFHVGAALADFKLEAGMLVTFVACLVLGPLLVFAPRLAAAKRTGAREYGTLAARYVREFDAKWLRGGAGADEALLGSADLQSLADLANGYEVVGGMRLAPITRDALVRLVAATALPITPLLLTVMPLEELTQRLVGMLF